MKILFRSIQCLFFLTLFSPLFLLAGTKDNQRIERHKNVSLINDRCSAYIFDSYPPVYYPSSIHWLSSISAFGDSVELEDGSVWKVSYYDQYKANHWRSRDPLIVTQNHRWFSKYAYRIINKTTGASIETNLHFGPIKNGELSLYITSIDPIQQNIQLTNGREEISHWEICSKDGEEFARWEPYHSVIVGYNSGWDSHYECILINVTVNNFVRAKQF